MVGGEDKTCLLVLVKVFEKNLNLSHDLVDHLDIVHVLLENR